MISHQGFACYTGGQALRPERPTVVLVHGALHDHSVFTLLARHLAHQGRNVLAVDLPAHGRSSGPPPATIEAAAQQLLALLDGLGIAQAAWVGHSMGSLIALEAAAQAPQRATQLLLLGTAAPMKVSDALLASAASDPLAAMRMVNVYSHSTLAAKPGYPGPGSWLHGANLALMERTQRGWPDGNLFLHDFQLCNQYTGALQAAAQVVCPATVISGQHDAMTPPRAAQALTAALRARALTLPCGHALMQEAPERLRECVSEAFLGRA